MKKLTISVLITLVVIFACVFAASAANKIDQSFSSTEGDLKWAFFESEATLSYNNTKYEAGTLVIYGTGTSYTYSQSIAWDNQSGYPWNSVKGSIKKVVFDTPNLEAMLTFGYMGASLNELHIPASVKTIGAGFFAALSNLHTIKVAGVDYSEYPGHVYDLRNITSLDVEAFANTASAITDPITVLFGENTTNGWVAGTRFCENSKSAFNFVVLKGSKGEALANNLKNNATNTSRKIADNISVSYFPNNLIDQAFASTEGDLKWAFFEEAGKLPYNGTNYDAGTLVIYGTGTSYAYSQDIAWNNQSGYPWYSVMSSINKVVFDTPNLTAINKLSYMGTSLNELHIPASVTTIGAGVLAALYKLNTVKVAGTDYSEYPGYVFDFRNITSIDTEALANVARDLGDANVTVLFGDSTNCGWRDGFRFCDSSASAFTFIVNKGTTGESFANYIKTNAESSTKLADNVTVAYYSNNLINQAFASTEGDLKWAFFEEAGKLSYNATNYEAGTLVIYGTGTSYAYSQKIAWNNQSGYPWNSVMGSIKKVVFDTPNLTAMGTFAYMGATLSELYIPASVTALSSDTFLGCYGVNTIKVVGEDYSDYEGNVYDLRNILTIPADAFGNAARDVKNAEITVLLGKNTAQSYVAGSRFCDSSTSAFTFMVYKDSKGETWANYIKTNATTSDKFADNVTVEYYEVREEAKSAMVFEGYQVRTTKYNGLRGLFTFDNTVENKDWTCIEYGTILSAYANIENYGAELTLKNGEYVTANDKIFKVSVMENDSIIGKTLETNDEYTKFATTVTRYTSNWKDLVYMCGYEIWQDVDGNIQIIYTDSMDASGELYVPSIYDVTIESYVSGLINSADEDENNVIWEVLDNCRNPITATPATYTVENNVIKHTSADVNIHTFKRSDATIVAIVKGSGEAKNVGPMLTDLKIQAATIIIDDGFTSIGNGCFQWYDYVVTLVYPEGIASVGSSAFLASASKLQTVFMVGTNPEIGTVDLSHVGKVDLWYLFNGTKTNILYIHLPTNLNGASVVGEQAFRKCTALKAIWCGNNEMIEGTANFSGTTIMGATGNGTNDKDSFYMTSGITSFIWGGSAK